MKHITLDASFKYKGGIQAHIRRTGAARRLEKQIRLGLKVTRPLTKKDIIRINKELTRLYELGVKRPKEIVEGS